MNIARAACTALLLLPAIGDATHWISVRGKDRAAPVIVVLHGGPGSPTLPTAWAYQTPWEDSFTVVQDDQRGVGKNALGADREALATTLSGERLEAPLKRFVTLEHSAHVPFLEEPGRFLHALLTEVLPLATKGAGEPPAPR